MSYYTYPVIGLGYSPDPDSVNDYETLADAIEGFFEDIRTTSEHKDIDMPDDLPSADAVAEAADNGGLVFAFGGWLHVIGRD